MYFILSLFWAVSSLFAVDRLFIVQGLDESLACINLESGNIEPQSVALDNIPNDIITHNGLIYVTSSGQNTIQEIDPVSMSTLRTLHVTGGVNVWSAMFINNDTIAVTCSISNNVIFMRASDEAVVGNAPAGVWPQGAIVSGNRLFVTSTGVDFPNYGPGSVLVYDCTTLQRLDSLPVGTNPYSASLDNQNRLHVVCTGNYDDVQGSIHIIDLATLETDTILQVGGTPATVAFSDEFAFVTAGGWIAGGEVYKYRMSNFEILNDATNPITTGFGAYDVEVAANGNFYVSCFDLDAVEYRTPTGGLVDSFLVSDGPGLMVVLPSAQESALPHPAYPNDFALADAFPNPFNGTVNLTLLSPQNRSQNIYFYNILGEVVDQVSVKPFQTQVAWTPRNSSLEIVSSGVYFARVESSNDFQSKRLIYVR